VKTTLIFVLLGALAGIVGASYVVPPALSWYTEPGGLPGGAQVQSLVNIPAVIQYATSKLLRWQMIGAGLGAIAGLVLGAMLASRRRRSLQAANRPAG
jgi:hypothetical protein